MNAAWRVGRARAAALALLALALAALPARGQEAGAPTAVPLMPTAERLQITDPYIELHTGPGRGYPIFFVVERKGWISIEMRHTDWYKVHTDDGKVGWVDRAQLVTTLTESGSTRSFRDVVLEDYLHRRVEFGAGVGNFSGAALLKAWTAYQLTDNIGLELDVGQVQGRYSGTSYWGVQLLAEPWADRRIGPFFGIGVGKIDNVPNASLIGAINNNAKMADATIGVRCHLSERLLARVDWTQYAAFVSSGRTDQYHAIAAGLAFFF